METYSYKVDSDVVKSEGDSRISRDDDVLASGSGKVVCGTVLGQITTAGATFGKFKPLAPAANDGTQTAKAIILQNADATAADVTVVNLKRHAQIVLQSLVWPAGITDAQKAAALASLENTSIVARNGV